MTAPAAIQATFSDFKVIRGRKVCQIIMELPLEAADAALATLGGLPRPDAERWFAIARLDLSKAVTPAPSEPEKPRQKWEDLAPATQAALRCDQPDFRRFIGEETSATAAEYVRRRCGVKSRGDLNISLPAAAYWRALDEDFQKSQRGFR